MSDQSSMNSKNLLCYARGKAGEWEAICVDFDIAVQGRSFDEVRLLLQRSIELYVEDVCRESSDDRARLLNRTAPASVRLKWAARVFWHWIGRKRDGGDGSYAGFDLPCHA